MGRYTSYTHNPTTRMLLQGFLAQWGHDVINCNDGGAEAWNILQQRDAPQLAILDWLMPEMDGIEVCRRVRTGARSMMPYIIFVTARDHEEDIVIGLQEGADDYVTKPFNKNELHARLTVGTRVVNMWNRLLEAERNRVLIQTAGAAAHEINNLLAVMQAQLQLLLAKSTDDTQKEKLKRRPAHQRHRAKNGVGPPVFHQAVHQRHGHRRLRRRAMSRRPL